MAEFQTSVDIGNRALQHCGAARMDPTQGFAENSKNAAEVSFCYGKLREAELQSNVWTFAVKYAALRAVGASTMRLAPGLWASIATYFAGSIVADESGNLWISRIPNNLNFQPQNFSLAWEPYFGPLTVSLYDSATSYFAGELVYTATGDGKARVYLSLQNDNTGNPATPTAYDAAAVYSKNQVVTYLSVAYMSLIDLNTGNTPSASPPIWDIATTYAAGDHVGASDGVIYTSIGSANIGNDPIQDGGANWTSTGALNPWTRAFVAGLGSDKWRQIGGAEFPLGVGLATLDIVYPLGVGPAAQGSTRNIFMLPNGYLREAPQNPKGVPTSWLGGPSGITYNDWIFGDGFLLTSESGVIVLRFVANMTDVNRMNPMFCEGLAARIAMEVCEPLTQSTAKLGAIAKVYQEWIDRAKTRNAIEQGYDEPPDDEYLTVRL